MVRPEAERHEFLKYLLSELGSYIPLNFEIVTSFIIPESDDGGT